MYPGIMSPNNTKRVGLTEHENAICTYFSSESQKNRQSRISEHSKLKLKCREYWQSVERMREFYRRDGAKDMDNLNITPLIDKQHFHAMKHAERMIEGDEYDQTETR
jgi:hypothetical protein